ncbi:hypothetical protein J8F10_14420 [Gemmata sp. G18]|uniref:Phage tail tape measure protein n=1 Tax=Gemmata palustris TaxID=2822762 RepID=A0ABS5BSS9_9BACT|nr:hypothetical protein [Gemmata palustris]MBP3956472.1 hypothetical protein [Gemmata palustris]
MAYSTNDLLVILNRQVGDVRGILRTLTPLVGRISGQLKDMKAGGPGAPPGPKKRAPSFFSQLQYGLKSTLKAIGTISAVVAGIIGAVTALPLALASIVKVAASFVRALNPYLVEQYEREVQNLRATIGYGLVPIVQYATKAVRDWAGILLPSIQMLRPLVERISAAVSGVFLGAVRTVARVMEGFAKVLTPLVGTIESNMAAWGALLEVIASVVAVAVEFGGAIQLWVTLSNSYADGLKRLITAVTILTARLIGALGGADALKKFRDSLGDAIESRKNPKRGLLAAPTDAGVSGIEDIARKMSERAFAATAGAGNTQKSETEFLEDIFKTVGEIQKEPIKNLPQIISDGVRDGIRAAAAAEFQRSPAGQGLAFVRDESAGLGDKALTAVGDLYRDGRAWFNRRTHTALGGN